MGTPKLRSQCSNSSNVPNDQLPVYTSRSHFTDCPTPPLVRPHARDSVLMYREKLGFSLRASTASAAARDTPGISVLEGIKSRAVQLPGSTRAESGRGKGRFGSRRVVETSDEPPSTLVSGKDVRLAIMTSSDDGVLGGPHEGDERESGHPDGTNSGARSWVDDTDGAVVSFASILNIAFVGRDKTGLPANARTSPDGEKETVCTQPPAGLANSPQTVPKGSFSPHNVGAGLNTAP